MEKKERKTKSTKLSPEQIQRLWEWALHEDNLFTSRANFFMVAEAMLFAAFAALLAGTSTNKWSIIIIGVAGIIVILVWLYIAEVQRRLTMNPIKDILRQSVPEYECIARGRKGWQTNIVLGSVLPLFLLFAWVALLCIN